MSAVLQSGFLILILGVLCSPAVYCNLPASLTLERVFPVNHKVELDELRAWDRTRHRRILQGLGGVVDFPVHGTADPYTVGLYYTKVKLGSPAREFYVQIDTGSDILWVNCNSCNGCPTSSGLQIQLSFFDPSKSSSASFISCSDQICTSAVQTAEASCSSGDSQCTYLFQYGDGSGTSGYYVSDMLSFDAVTGNSMTANSSASVIFGCSNYQSGDLTKPDRAVDGIFGFGQHGLSVISQLSSLGVAPKVFSHCFVGSDNGGGILVLGEIVEPNIVYTSLVPSQPHYNLNLQSIFVNGQLVPIDSSVFETSSNRGTIIDSGTTLAYLAEEAYDPFVTAITNAVSQSVSPIVSKGSQCYLSSNSVNDIFPSVNLNFQGGVSLILKPEEYLIRQGSVDGTALWCIGFQKVQGQEITILGDLVLKDKIFVYDLAAQRIGWADYDCSLSVNVSASRMNKDESVNAGQVSISSSLQNELYKMIPTIFASFLVHISIFCWFFFM